MIIIKLTGGLGNQMFQYALYKKFLSMGKEVYLDKSWFSTKKSILDKRVIHIGKSFGLKVTESDYKNPISLSFEINLFPRLLNKLLSLFSDYRLVNKTENHLPVIIEKNDIDPNFYLELNCGYFIGYWQSPIYFKDLNIDKIFDFRAFKREEILHLLKEIKHNLDFAAIHIRRGDYKKNKYLGILDSSYYDKSIKQLIGKVKIKKLFVFSDEIDSAVKILNKVNFNIETVYISNLISQLDDFDELEIMSNFKNIIISNSTFSWWAAILNSNLNKNVIAPKSWNSKNIESKDFIPKSWIRL